MKTIILFFMLLITCNSFSQNDYIMLSRTRPIVEVEINGRKAAMLIDTGSELNLITKSMVEVLVVMKKMQYYYQINYVYDSLSITGVGAEYGTRGGYLWFNNSTNSAYNKRGGFEN